MRVNRITMKSSLRGIVVAAIGYTSQCVPKITAEKLCSFRNNKGVCLMTHPFWGFIY